MNVIYVIFKFVAISCKFQQAIHIGYCIGRLKIVIVSGRLDNRVRLFNDNSDGSGQEQSNVVSLPTPGLNNYSATNAKKKKDTNTYKTPSNVDYYPDDDNYNGSEMSYGFETRQEPVDRQRYVDSLVIGTFKHTIIYWLKL